MQMDPKPSSNVISLSDLRRKHEQVVRKEYVDPSDRIRDLEADLLRLIDHAMDIEERLFRQERYLSRLVVLLKNHVKP